MSRVVVGNYVYKLVVAQDPLEEMTEDTENKDDSSEEMVEELRDSPADNWREYLQPIIVNIRNAYGLEIGQVSIVGPRIVNKFTSPQYGFSITGHVRFKPEPPEEVLREHGEPPYRFDAAVTPDGDLISSIQLLGSEG